MSSDRISGPCVSFISTGKLELFYEAFVVPKLTPYELFSVCHHSDLSETCFHGFALQTVFKLKCLGLNEGASCFAKFNSTSISCICLDSECIMSIYIYASIRSRVSENRDQTVQLQKICLRLWCLYTLNDALDTTRGAGISQEAQK